MARPPIDFKTDLNFSFNNEDYAAEFACLDAIPGNAKRVLIVPGGGDTALNLLLRDDVAHVRAADLHAPQLHYLDLRRAAIVGLKDRRLISIFLGMVPPAELATQQPLRTELYEKVKELLRPDARAFWDERANMIAHGVAYSSTVEKIFARTVASIESTPFSAARLLSGDPSLASHPDFVPTIEKAWDMDYFIKCFAFDKLPPKAFEGLKNNLDLLPGLFTESYRRQVANGNTDKKAFLFRELAGHWGTFSNEYPLWLTEDAVRKLSADNGRRFDRLECVAGNVLEQLALASPEKQSQKDAVAPYHLVALSNICDWMDSAGCANVARASAGALAPGGAVLLRRSLSGLGPVFDAQFGQSEERMKMERAARRAERSVLFGFASEDCDGICVGVRPSI